jgi:polar amino acid transport system substrate-binding protein
MTRTRLWLVLAFAALLATAMVAAGCGDDDEEGDGGATTAATEDLGLTNEGTLLVGSDIPYPPFEQGDPPDYEGFDIDVINAVGEQMGLDVEIVDVPFDLVLTGGEGRFDLAIAATTITPARENRVDFSDPYFESEQSLLVQADGDIASIDDLTADVVVGAQDGTTGETYAEENSDAEIRPFPEIDDAYNALAGGQVDAVMNDLDPNNTAAEENPDLEVVETYATGEQYGIVMPDGATELTAAVNEALATIKEDGTLDSIYEEWFQKPAPESVLDATHEAS